MKNGGWTSRDTTRVSGLLFFDNGGLTLTHWCAVKAQGPQNQQTVLFKMIRRTMVIPGGMIACGTSMPSHYFLLHL